MSAAIAACFCGGEVIIKGAEAVEKSYPRFFEDYRMLGGEADVI
jgi:3-phosphoshikimate 1-carboxyvinyltransferase